jgi:hypothetical protein
MVRVGFRTTEMLRRIRPGVGFFMADSRKLTDFSRQELYDLIWSTPVTQVAADFGVTEVTVKNHCNNRRVPRPAQRYWKAMAAGGRPRKKPLPPSAQEVFETEAQRRVPKCLALPALGTPLHPLAAELLRVLNKTKPDHKKLIHLKEPSCPEVNISKALAERVAQSFHVILQAVEPLGIEFRKYSGSYNSGYFRRGQDRLFLTIEEVLIDPLSAGRRARWWQWTGTGTPTGHLAFSFEAHRYQSGEEKEWLETKKHPLERVLSEAVCAVRLHFLTLQRKHIQEVIDRKKWKEDYEKRHREWQAKEAIRIQKEREQAHLNAIAKAIDDRKQDLIKAAEWWRRSRGITDFVEESERRWKIPSGVLDPEQAAWLAWAKEIANSMSPFTAGYPDPPKHGAFDPSTIPFGGTYPPAQNLSPVS